MQKFRSCVYELSINLVYLTNCIQVSLDQEIRNRAELTRTKKKMEGDISDLEIQASKYRKQVEQVMKTNKDYQCQIKDLQTKLDDEQRKYEDIQENTLVIERRSNLLQSEIEELRSGLEQAERIWCTFILMSTELLFYLVL